MKGLKALQGGPKSCNAHVNRKTKRERDGKTAKKEGDGETSEMRTDVQISDQFMEIGQPMETSEIQKMIEISAMEMEMEKMKRRDGETSEKRIDVEISEGKHVDAEGFLSSKDRDYLVISPYEDPYKEEMEMGLKPYKEMEMEMELEHSGQQNMILIEEGKHVDVKGFLSSENRDYLVSSKDGTLVPISSLEGKNILICCFAIPFDLDTGEASVCQSIQALYSHLSDIGISDSVKLVIVLKHKQDEDDASAASSFDSFFSWFPLNCLTIPFFDSQSRHYVCSALRMPHLSDCFHSCLAIDPSGLVVQVDSYLLRSCGARSFPFTSMHFDDITRYDNFIKLAICSNNNHVILQELLQCRSFSQIAQVGTKSVPLTDLIEAPVGLYLYCDGSFIDDLRVLHKSCRDKGLNFNVVVVPAPFGEHYDPAFFCDRMKQSALEDEISSSWLVFPFHDDICRTLWRVTCTHTDAFIILPHGDFCGDLDGRAVASTYGIDAYPFSKDAVIKPKINHLRSLPLDRLLGKDFTDMWDLHNKNVLLCFEEPCFEGSSLYKYLKRGYRKIKQRYPDCEVVLVRLKPHLSYADADIDWRILPSEKCETVINHIFTADQLVYRALCAFGKDGKLLSRCVWDCLPIGRSSIPLFGDMLYSEIFEDVRDELLDHQYY